MWKVVLCSTKNVFITARTALSFSLKRKINLYSGLELYWLALLILLTMKCWLRHELGLMSSLFVCYIVGFSPRNTVDLTSRLKSEIKDIQVLIPSWYFRLLQYIWMSDEIEYVYENGEKYFTLIQLSSHCLHIRPYTNILNPTRHKTKIFFQLSLEANVTSVIPTWLGRFNFIRPGNVKDGLRLKLVILI